MTPLPRPLPPRWRWATVEELASDIQTGPFGAQLHRDEFVPQGIPVLGVGNVQHGHLDLSELVFVTPKKAEDLSRYLLRAGDVLFTRSGSVGRSAIVPESGDGYLMTGHLLRLRVDLNRYMPSLLILAFRGEPTIAEQLKRLTRGATRAGFNTSLLASLELPLPPLREQRHIVAKIEALQSRSRKAKEALDEIPKLLEQYRQSVLAAAFRGDLTADWREQNPNVEPASELLNRIRRERRKKWEEANPKKKYVEPEPVDDPELPELPDSWIWTTLEQITPAHAPIVYGIILPGEHVPDGVPFVRPVDIVDGAVDLDLLPRTDPMIALKYQRASLLAGDIVFSVVGTIGKWIVATETLNGANITQSSVRIRPLAPIPALYIVRALQSPHAKLQMARMQFGNAVQRLNVDHVRKLVIPLAPPAEIVALSRKVETLLSMADRRDADVVSAIQHLAAFDQSILAKAFRGELVPQDPNDEPALVTLVRGQELTIQH